MAKTTNSIKSYNPSVIQLSLGLSFLTVACLLAVSTGILPAVRIEGGGILAIPFGLIGLVMVNVSYLTLKKSEIILRKNKRLLVLNIVLSVPSTLSLAATFFLFYAVGSILIGFALSVIFFTVLFVASTWLIIYTQLIHWRKLER